MGGSFAGVTSGCGLAGSLSFVGGFNGNRGLLTGGPPVFRTRGAFGGTLTAGNDGGTSITGVLGI